MKIRFLTFVVLCFFSTFVSGAESVNLVQNPSFEKGNDNTQEGWLKGSISPNTTHSTADKGHSGRKSATIESKNGSAGEWVQFVRIKPDTKYKFSGWYKLENIQVYENSNGGVQFCAHTGIFDENGQEPWYKRWKWGNFDTGITFSEGFTGTTDWKKFEGTLKTGPNDSHVFIGCRFGVLSDKWQQVKGKVYFDDIELIEQKQDSAKTSKTNPPNSTTNQNYLVSDDFTVTLGKRETFMRYKQYKLPNYLLIHFPDQQIGFLDFTPKVRCLMTMSDSTWLFEGNDLWSLMPVKPVLFHGPPRSIDSGYIGASSVLHDPKNKKRTLAFCHTENRENMPTHGANDIQGFYATVFLAESFDSGYSFQKIGPVITGDIPKSKVTQAAGGCGDPCVIFDKDKKYYLAYYLEWGQSLNRGVQLCMARCAVKDGGLPGKWCKYHEGEFKEPGLGGKDTPLISEWNIGDTMQASVAYVKSIDKYVMVHTLLAHKEWAQRDKVKANISGFYVRISDDGIIWSNSKQILSGYAVPIPKKEFLCHPTLVPIKTSQSGFQGYLLYSYSERWALDEAHDPTGIPHYFVGQSISFGFERENKK